VLDLDRLDANIAALTRQLPRGNIRLVSHAS